MIEENSSLSRKCLFTRERGALTMGDLFLLLLIFLMVSYAFWDQLFTD